MFKNIENMIESVYAQEMIPCSDGTLADPTIGCVTTPGSVVNPESSLLSIILQIADNLMLFVAGVATIMLIYGAIKYATGIGSEEALSKAKRIMLWSTFGLILALLSKFVVSMILGIVG